MARHLAFARAGQAMRVDGEQTPLKVAAGTAKTPQAELKSFGMFYGMGHEQVMNARIGNHERETVEKFEAFLAERAVRTGVHHSQGGFMNKLHGRAGGKIGRGGTGPVSQQIPGSQAQVFGGQQPETDEVAGNLIGQQLADAAFDAEAIESFAPVLSQGAKGFQFHDRTLGMKLIEFFFGGQTG